MTVDDTIIISAFSAAWTGTLGVVGMMWRKLNREHELLRAAHKTCEEKHEALALKLGGLTGDSELLKRCPATTCPFKAKPEHDHFAEPVPLHA